MIRIPIEMRGPVCIAFSKAHFIPQPIGASNDSVCFANPLTRTASGLHP